MKIFLILIIYFSFTVAINSQTWEKITSPYGGALTSISVNSQVNILVAAGGDKLYYSTDLGENWKSSESWPNGGNNNPSAFIDNKNNFYITGDYGYIYRSTNYGSTWEIANKDYKLPEFADLQNKLYSKYNGILNISEDLGKTWVPINDFKSTINNLFTINNGLYVATANGIFYSIDNGWTWTGLNSGIEGKNIVFITEDSEKNLYCTAEDIIYKWNSTLIKWIPFSTAPDPNWISNLYFDSDSKIFATTNMNKIYVSSDKGQSWISYFNSALPNVQGSLKAKFHMNFVFLSTRDGFYRSDASSNSWLLKNKGLNILRIRKMYIDNENYLYAVDNDYFNLPVSIFVKSPSENEWQRYRINNSIGSYECQLTGDSKGNVFFVDGNILFRTTDKGKNWTKPFNGNVYNINISNGNKIFVGCDDGIYYSENSGNNWVKVSNLSSKIVSITNNDNKYYAYGDSKIYKSIDAGMTWAPLVRYSNFYNYFNLYVDKKDYLYVVDSRILISNDEGKTWVESKTNNVNSNIGCLFLHPDGYILAGTYNGIYASKDQGNSWTRFSDGVIERSNGYATVINSIVMSQAGKIYASAGDFYDHSNMYMMNYSMPSIPTAIAPFDSSTITVDSIKFEWNAADNAKYYDLVISNDSLFTNIYKTVSNITSTNCILAGFERAKLYYWHVKAVNELGSIESNSLGFFKINKTYNVAVSSLPVEGGKVSGGGSFIESSIVVVKESTNNGYTFVNWTENGKEVSSDSVYKFTIHGDKTLVANYKINTRTLKVLSENGTITKIPELIEYDYGTIVKISAVPQKGFVFTGWSGDTISLQNPISIKMNRDKTITANFILNKPLTPILLSPLDKLTDQAVNINFIWDKTENTDTYRFILSKDTLFTNNLIDDSTVTTCTQYTLNLIYAFFMFKSFSI